jgi:hypothetical protein
MEIDPAEKYAQCCFRVRVDGWTDPVMAFD